MIWTETCGRYLHSGPEKYEAFTKLIPCSPTSIFKVRKTNNLMVVTKFIGKDLHRLWLHNTQTYFFDVPSNC